MTERTDTTIQRKTVLFVTTADTDILTAERALSGMPDDYPHVRAFNPVALETPEAQEELMTALEDAGVVILRLLGGKQSMPQLFDQLVRDCRVRGIPLIALPGHQEWDEDLVTSCTVPVAARYLYCSSCSSCLIASSASIKSLLLI